VQATTLDTTSHSFQFSIDTLGVTSSRLFDVAVINDTLAYAVGEIYLRDTTGLLDLISYNLAKWDGVRWHIMRIQFFTICGQTSRTPYPASSVFALSATDVWITSRGGQLAHWDGTTQIATICNPDPFVINKLWGENPNSIWAVGYGGRISHYTNGAWQRVESGTGLQIYDVRGIASATHAPQVLAVAAQQTVNFEHCILSLAPNSVATLPDSGIPGSLNGLWFVPQREYYVVGWGIFSKHSITARTPWTALHQNLTSYYIYSIDGQGLNDVVVCGSFGELLHYNGYSWRSYREVVGISVGAYYKIVMKGNLCVAVGYESPRALVAIGRR
jgi:hypothetical protein